MAILLVQRTTPQPGEHFLLHNAITTMLCILYNPIGLPRVSFWCCLERLVVPESDTGGFMPRELTVKGPLGTSTLKTPPWRACI